jgi:hypothetical protein
MKRCEIHDTPMQESVVVPGLHRCWDCIAEIDRYVFNQAMGELSAPPRTRLEPQPGLVTIPGDDELDPGEKAEFPENFE